MLPNISAVVMITSVGLAGLGLPGLADKRPASHSDELHVSNLHVAVSAMPGSPRQVVFTGVLPGYHRDESGTIENIACIFAADPRALLPEQYDAARVRNAVGNLQPDGAFQIGVPLYLVRRQPQEWTDLHVRFVGPVSRNDESAAIFSASVLGEDSVDIGTIPELSASIQAVNSAPSVLDANYDPLLTVRACNAVMRMGKERALMAMKAYTYIAADPFIWEQLPGRPESLDASDLRRVILLLHLACEPLPPAKPNLRNVGDGQQWIDLGERERLDFNPQQGWHPLWYCGMAYARPQHPKQFPGSDYPFVVESDVPFYLPDLMGSRTGYDSQPGPYITYFERSGEFRRAGVYRPTGTLGDILDRAIERIPSKKQELCEQVLALVPKEAKDLPPGAQAYAERLRTHDCEPVRLLPEDWEPLREWLHRTPLVWDEKAEEFVKK